MSTLQQPKAVLAMRRTDPEQFCDYWMIYGEDWIASSSDRPAHPTGVWGMNDVRPGEWWKWDTECGEAVSWEDLPLTLQSALVSYFPDEEIES